MRDEERDVELDAEMEAEIEAELDARLGKEPGRKMAGGMLAGRWARLWGALIDALIAMAIAIPVLFAMGVFKDFDSRGSQGLQLTLPQMGIMLLVGWGSFLAIHGYLLATRGQTVGKLLVGTRIADFETGEVPSFWKIITLRYLLWGLIGQIPIVGSLMQLANILFIFGDARRCLHDYTAGTNVLKVVPQ